MLSWVVKVVLEKVAMDAEVACAYQRLKPVCEKLLKCPEMQNLAEVMKSVQVLPESVLQELHIYILFPFVTHLKIKEFRISSKLRMSFVDGFYLILSKIHIESKDVFFKYYTILIYQLFDKTAKDSIAKVDEDFALKVFKCVTVAILRMPSEVRKMLYTRATTPEIGQGIFFCVQIARTERYKALKLSAVECAMALSTVHDEVYKDFYEPTINATFADSVGEVLMFFLPGLLGGLLEIATGDNKQGEKITCLAVRAIRRVITIVMLDKVNKTERTVTDIDFYNLFKSHSPDENKLPNDYDPFGKKIRGQGKENMVRHLETATRDKLWYKAAGVKLSVIIRSLRGLKVHEHQSIRHELALLCSDMVEHCLVNMTPSMKFIFEILIALSESDNKLLMSVSSDALTNFKNKTEHGNRELMSNIEQNFHTYLSQMPRILHTLDELHQLGNLCYLRGYLRFLGAKCVNNELSKLEEMLSSSFIMNRFIMTLIQIFKMDNRKIKLLEEYTVRDVSAPDPATTIPWKTFTYLTSLNNIAMALDICRLVGSYDVVNMICDHLFEMLRNDTESRKEVILILNETICCPTADSSKRKHLYKTLINTYIEPELWYLPTSVCKREKPIGKDETLDLMVYNPRSWTKESTLGLFEGAVETRCTDVSYRPPENPEDEPEKEDDIELCHALQQARDNVIQVCLITEGIGLAAKQLGNEFQPYLLRTLYLILERAGSSNEFLHSAGLTSLHHIKDAFKLGSIPELITMNSDYFTYHVKIKLRKIDDNPGVLDVLLVVMKYCESTILPCLYDIVSNILHQCFGMNEQKNMLLYLRIFQTFVKYIRVKFTEENLGKERVKAATAKLHILKQILDFRELKIKSVNFQDDIEKISTHELNEQYLNMNGHEEDTEEEEDKSKPKVPPHITMVASVLSKSVNFIPSNDGEQKLLALSIIKEGIPVLKDHEDICLPIVHQIWAPLLLRIKDSTQLLVMHRAYETLAVLINCSNDFLKARTLQEVFPIACGFLIDSSKESYCKDIGAVYGQSQKYKLQVTMLEQVIPTCLSLQVQERYLYCVMETMEVYLNSKQPKPLQELTVGIFKNIMTQDPALTWMYLMSKFCQSKAAQPPKMYQGSCELRPFLCKVDESSSRYEYRKNIEVLLNDYNIRFPNFVTNSFTPALPTDYDVKSSKKR